MFSHNKDFYPTPEPVIIEMLNGINITNKIILEPSAGKGNIVDYLLNNGAQEVIACEKDSDLQSILFSKCRILKDDFMEVESHEISHIDLIVMNPPFTADEKHITHAWNIAPAGCIIIALCNTNTLKNQYTKDRVRLANIVAEYGTSTHLKDCFTQAERQTGVEIDLVHLTKPGQAYTAEFGDFFLEEDEPETQDNGIMPYNVIRDIVNRYVQAVKIYDKQLEYAIQMNNITSGFYSAKMGMTITQDGAPKSRNDFKKEMQKSGWKFIFEKMNLQQHATKGLREDINTFIEKQTQFPFTMRNIYLMIEGIISNTGNRMDKALLEVFDKVTAHTKDNRFNLEGWKTNSYYLLNQKFIIDRMAPVDKWHTGNKLCNAYGSSFELIEDFLKALCFITGDRYQDFEALESFAKHPYKIYAIGDTKNRKPNTIYPGDKFLESESDRNAGKYPTTWQSTLAKAKEKHYNATEFYIPEVEYGQLFEWAYFEVRAFKKGTMHFKFKSPELWAQFNQRIAKIKGYPLYEHRPETKKPNPTPYQGTTKPNANTVPMQAKILFTAKVA